MELDTPPGLGSPVRDNLYYYNTYSDKEDDQIPLKHFLSQTRGRDKRRRRRTGYSGTEL